MKRSPTMARPLSGQEEVDIGDAAVLRVLDRDDRLAGAAVLHRIQRILEGEARQRQAMRQALRAAARCELAPGAPLKRHGAFGIGRRGRGHFGDEAKRGSGKAGHGPMRYQARRKARQGAFASVVETASAKSCPPKCLAIALAPAQGPD